MSTQEVVPKPLLVGRTNPDGRQIGATFFVPHEYTDYKKVNYLYNYGFEIGVNSITKNSLQDYWRTASKEIIEKEFAGQKKVISKFANIPEEDIVGVRTPQLQLAGNNSIEGYTAAGLSYDSSWPTNTMHDLPLFPYILDYLSTQQCNLGYNCPNESFKGFWILPINDFRGNNDVPCNSLATCGVSGTADEIAAWLINQVELVRSGSRAPLTLIVESYWFEIVENSSEGFTKFLNTMGTYEDVFFVSQKQVVDWMKNPVPLSQFQTELFERNAACSGYGCDLATPDGAERHMGSCIPCPASYPWLDNPEGN